MNGKHTPGPWCRDGHNMSSVIKCTVPRGHPDAQHLCGDFAEIATTHGPDWDANARLITAAPDLLAALSRAEEYVERFADMNDEPEDGDCRSALEAIRAAITKAEGDA